MVGKLHRQGSVYCTVYMLHKGYMVYVSVEVFWSVQHEVRSVIQCKSSNSFYYTFYLMSLKVSLCLLLS